MIPQGLGLDAPTGLVPANIPGPPLTVSAPGVPL